MNQLSSLSRSGRPMLRWAMAAALAGLGGTAGAADVGVSLSFSQPGVYGRVDIGQFPQPAVIVPQPMIIQPPMVQVGPPVQPVYLWVPPAHRRNWRHYCARYQACGVPVYFVREDWYRQHVEPAQRYRGGPPPGRGWDRGDDGGDRGHDRGHGRGRGRDDGDR